MEDKKKMKAQTIEVPIEATMKISASTVRGCLRLLEMYLDDHPSLTIVDSYRATDSGMEHRLEILPKIIDEDEGGKE